MRAIEERKPAPRPNFLRNNSPMKALVILALAIKVEGNTIAVEGTLPEGYKRGERIFVPAAAQNSGVNAEVVSHVRPQPVTLQGLTSPEVHLSAISKADGTFPVVYEAFHYLKPRERRILLVR